MKKILLIIFLSCFLLPATADEEVYLDLNAGDVHQYKTFLPKAEKLNINKKEDDEDYIFRPMEYIKSEMSEMYSQKKLSNKHEKKFGKTKIGVKHDTTLAPESVSQKRTLYTKYDLTEKMSVGADYQTDSLEGAEAQTQGTVGVGPEYQLTDKLKLKNKYSKNLGTDTNKGEVSVEYKPFKDGRMDFNAGAAQTRQDNGPGSSQVNFGTNFRF